MQRQSFSEALRLASYCPPPLQPTLPGESPNIANALCSPFSSSIRTPSLTTTLSNDYSNSTSLLYALPSSEVPKPSQPVSHSSLYPSPTTLRGIYTDHSRNNQPDNIRIASINQSRSQEKWTEVSDKEVVNKNHQMFAVQRDQLQSNIAESPPATFVKSLNDSSVLAKQGFSGNSDTETRRQLLELQRKYNTMLARLDQKTMVSESLTEELRLMQDDLNKMRKSCITLADIVHDIAYNEFQPPIQSTTEIADISTIESSSDAHTTSYTTYGTNNSQLYIKSKPKNVVKQDELVYPIDLTKSSGSLGQNHAKFTTSLNCNTSSHSSPDVTLKESPVKLPHFEAQEKIADPILQSKGFTPVFNKTIHKATLEDSSDLNMVKTTIGVSKPLPSPNTSIPSISNSSRASSRQPSRRRSVRRSSTRSCKNKIKNNQLYLAHRRQIPLVIDLINSTEAELHSFQRHLDEVLKIAKQDPNKTWERGEEIRLLCQAISAKKAALNKLWILRGETDKALDAMELEIDQMHVLGHKIQTRLEVSENPLSTHVYTPTNAKSSIQRKRLSKSAKVNSTYPLEREHQLASEIRPRSISALKRHEKCVIRPTFEPFKARPNPFAS